MLTFGDITTGQAGMVERKSAFVSVFVPNVLIKGICQQCRDCDSNQILSWCTASGLQ